MEEESLVTVYAHINTVPNGSTGGIMMKEHRELLAAGEESYVFWGRGREAKKPNEMKFASDVEVKLDVLQTRLDGKAGFHSKNATRRLLARLDEIQPDVVHLHNLHGYYVNIEMLFKWLANHECKVEWTLHDCWAFTGHCAHFTYVKCAQWMDHCAYSSPCSQLNTYPRTYSKSSCSWNFEQKSQLFNLVPPERMKIITPSKWLATLVGKSFLKGYPVEVRHNTIDTDVFKPTPSDFRERYGVGDRFMILGVASPWTARKGLNDFVKLADELDSEKCAIVLVGLSEKQVEGLPGGVVGLIRTDSREELAGIYSTADVFFNPTTEDNFPTVNLEAEACGTPVITYDTGGCAETIRNSDSCVVGKYEDARNLFKRYRRLNIVVTADQKGATGLD